MAKQYQENRDIILKKRSEYHQKNKTKIIEYQSVYRQLNKEKIAEHKAEYYSKPFGRARRLISNYKYVDKKYNRGECTLTPQWIVDNIFTQPCHYCGETDWHKLGCDRIDNTKPHTPDNVVPCCFECNTKRGTTSYDEFMDIN